MALLKVKNDSGWVSCQNPIEIKQAEDTTQRDLSMLFLNKTYSPVYFDSNGILKFNPSVYSTFFGCGRNGASSSSTIYPWYFFHFNDENYESFGTLKCYYTGTLNFTGTFGNFVTAEGVTYQKMTIKSNGGAFNSPQGWKNIVTNYEASSFLNNVSIQLFDSNGRQVTISNPEDYYVTIST